MNYENLEAYELLPEIANEFEYEMYEAELTHELLNLQSEEELNHFLGGLIKKAWSGAKSLYNSPTGQAIKGQIISGAKAWGRKKLPEWGQKAGGFLGRKAGGWLGGKLGGPAGQQAGADAFGQAGSWLGGAAGDWAANRYLNEYEYEYEAAAAANANPEMAVARGILRLTRQAAIEIAAAAQSGRPLDPKLVRGIILRNARQQFPQMNFSNARRGTPNSGGIQSEYDDNGNGGAPSYSQPSGTWYRQGNQITLTGV